ncbi:hypothetical protein WA026_017828 [Henosepilachna vigintioctopunctata]|uniref:CHK kinase-like domain-containing protein n=1 Tax=Henosepilachna vigintioctopunctata TaxID=420089 RepID=A0AAW1TUV1_9CUCU
MNMINFEEEQLKEIVKKVIVRYGIGVDASITISKGSDKVDGYLGEIVRIFVKDGNNTLNLIVKIGLKDEKLRANFPYSEAISNEILAYEKILPSFLNLQIEAKFPTLFNPFAKFYSASSALNQEYLILEDLKVSKFEMLEMKELLDHDHTKLICETYGKLHGLSFALKTLKKENFMGLDSELHEVVNLIFTIYNIGKEFSKMWKYIQTVMREKGIECKRINNYVDNSFSMMKDMSDIREEKFTCLLHGDCWTNNLMFKHKNYDGQKKVEDIKLIDWQACRIGPPVFDISYTLYSGASKDVFSNLKMYLNIYYENLSKTLALFDLDANSVYPFEEMKRQWKKYYHYGTILAAPIWKFRSFGENQGVDPLNYTSDDDSSFLHAISDAECDKDYLSERIKELMHHLDEIDGGKLD